MNSISHARDLRRKKLGRKGNSGGCFRNDGSTVANFVVSTRSEDISWIFTAPKHGCFWKSMAVVTVFQNNKHTTLCAMPFCTPKEF